VAINIKYERSEMAEDKAVEIPKIWEFITYYL